MKWIGLETAKRLHKEEEGVIFIDVRDRRDYVAGHIAEAYCTPLPEIIVTWFQYDPMTIALMRIHFHPYKEDRDEMVIDVN